MILGSHKKHRHTGLLIFIVVLLLIIGGAAASYCAFAEQYADRFLEGTFINGLAVGGMTAEDVETSIKDRVEDYSLTLLFADGMRERLKAEQIGFRYQTDDKIKDILTAQNKYAWIRGKLGKTEMHQVGEAFVLDEEKLRSAVASLPELSSDGKIAPKDAYMTMGEDHRLMIVPEIDGNENDVAAVADAAVEAVKRGDPVLDVSQLPVYSRAEVRADDPTLVLQVTDLNTYLDESITYTMYDGSEIVLNKDTMYAWLSVREDDPDFYYLNTNVLLEKCRAFVADIAAKYDYVKNSVVFHTSWSGDMEMACSDYGRVIDQEAETAQLYDDILSRMSHKRAPLYSLERDADGTFGGTYVEVDIDAQHAWYYEGGQLMWESDCVTGKGTDEDRRTPKGVFDIYTKERNRTLKGEINPATGNPSYESFVNFWMPFYEGVGLHDATWRGSFGGNIYWNSGSHGCVNLPYSRAEELYNLLEVGTTVIVH